MFNSKYLVLKVPRHSLRVSNWNVLRRLKKGKKQS